jgi:hypothetical protein
MAKILNNGRGLERTVAEIYTDLAYIPIQNNVYISKSSGGKTIRAEIDIIYNYLSHQRYVECKYRKNHKVTLEEVSKFAAVLGLFDIPIHNGEVITNNYFDDRAIRFSKDTGIILIDRDELKKLSDSRWQLLNMYKSIKVSTTAYKSGGIKKLLSYMYKRSASVDEQIRRNSY